ncbi:MAG: hypothetical protein ACTHK3_01470 [Solirubrobacterales bacterium]
MAQPPQTIEIPYRWTDVESTVRVTVATNEDPAALGCGEDARGFPCCTATLQSVRVGYQHLGGWVQLVDHTAGRKGFEIDHFPSLKSNAPFIYGGYAPILFDAPHTNELENWDFLAHSFYCGIGGELGEFRKEARAILGFSWGFSKQGQRIEWFGPESLSSRDWDGQLERLTEERPEWSFRPGFSKHPLEP